MSRTVTADEARVLLEGTTPGPWHAGGAYVRVSDEEPLIARVLDDDGSDQGKAQAPRNARLIAAAPDLAATVIAQAEEIERLRRALTPDYLEARICDELAAEVTHLRDRRGAALDEIDRLTRERDEMRAIIEGRTTPPSDEEIAAHDGAWLGATVMGSTWTDTSPAETRRKRGLGLIERWWPLDADGRPCPWPIAGGAR